MGAVNNLVDKGTEIIGGGVDAVNSVLETAGDIVASAADAIGDTTDAVVHAAGKVADFLGDTIKNVLSDPKKMAMVALTIAYPGLATGLGETLGLSGATATAVGNTLINTAVNGGDINKAARTALAQYAGSEVGADAADVLKEAGIDQTLANVGGRAVSSGVAAEVLGGDPLLAMLSGGISAGTAAITKNIEGFDQLSNAQQRAVNTYVSYSLQGKDPTNALVNQTLNEGIRFAQENAKGMDYSVSDGTPSKDTARAMQYAGERAGEGGSELVKSAVESGKSVDEAFASLGLDYGDFLNEYSQTVGTIKGAPEISIRIPTTANVPDFNKFKQAYVMAVRGGKSPQEAQAFAEIEANKVAEAAQQTQPGQPDIPTPYQEQKIVQATDIPPAVDVDKQKADAQSGLGAVPGSWVGGMGREVEFINPLQAASAAEPIEAPKMGAPMDTLQSAYSPLVSSQQTENVSGSFWPSSRPEPSYYAYGSDPTPDKTLSQFINPGMASTGFTQQFAKGGEVMASPLMAATGGDVPHKGSHYVQGAGGGQDDLISAKLADGEYVLDAEIVAALGDGSNRRGAEILDKWREEIRKHKRTGSTKTIPPKAKSPLAYMKGIKNG